MKQAAVIPGLFDGEPEIPERKIRQGWTWFPPGHAIYVKLAKDGKLAYTYVKIYPVSGATKIIDERDFDNTEYGVADLRLLLEKHGCVMPEYHLTPGDHFEDRHRRLGERYFLDNVNDYPFIVYYHIGLLLIAPVWSEYEERVCMKLGVTSYETYLDRKVDALMLYECEGILWRAIRQCMKVIIFEEDDSMVRLTTQEEVTEYLNRIKAGWEETTDEWIRLISSAARSSSLRQEWTPL